SGRRRRALRPPLRPPADATLRRTGHVPRLVRVLQHLRRSRRIHRGNCESPPAAPVGATPVATFVALPDAQPTPCRRPPSAPLPQPMSPQSSSWSPPPTAARPVAPAGPPRPTCWTATASSPRSCWQTSPGPAAASSWPPATTRSEEHTSELQSRENLVCRLLL